MTGSFPEQPHSPVNISSPEQPHSPATSSSPLESPETTISSVDEQSESEVRSSPSSDDSPLDIGVLLKRGKLQSLPRSLKLQVVNHNPDSKFNYPKTYLNGCNRRFKPEWARTHPWLHYSASEDGVYCKACALFGPSEVKQQKLGIFVSKPFSVWTKQSSVFTKHEQLTYHQSSMTVMTAFKDSCSNP